MLCIWIFAKESDKISPISYSFCNKDCIQQMQGEKKRRNKFPVKRVEKLFRSRVNDLDRNQL